VSSRNKKLKISRRAPLGRAPRLAKKRQERLYAYIALTLSGLVALVIFAGVLSGQEYFRIRDVSVQGISFSKQGDAVVFVKEQLLGNYLVLFPRSNIYLYPKSEIEKELRLKFVAIESTHISLTADRVLEVQATERKPAALWCPNGSSFGSSTDKSLSCYFMDGENLIFAKAPTFSDSPYFIYYGGISSGDPLGQYFMMPDQFKEIEFFNRSLLALGLHPKAFGVTGEGDYNIVLTEGSVLLLSPRRSLSDALDALRAFLGDLKPPTSGPEFISSLEYLDLRFTNKIYYKEKK
jgi:hypothetical protein